MTKGKFSHLPLSVDRPLECPYMVRWLSCPPNARAVCFYSPRHSAETSYTLPITTKAPPSHIENAMTSTSTASFQQISRGSKNKFIAHTTNIQVAETILPKTL